MLTLTFFVCFQPSGTEDSDHEYETVDESFVDMMKTAQESIMFY